MTRKGNGILITLSLNSVTTLKKENLNKKVKKIIITTTREEHKMVKDKTDMKIVKIEAEVLVKKEQITKGLQFNMRKVIRMKNTLHQRNQEINTATRKISINLGNSTVLQYNKKIK